MTLTDYEAAFHGIDLPETLDLFPGTHVPNVKEFIEKSILMYNTTTSNTVREAVKLRLDRALDLITSQNAQ